MGGSSVGGCVRCDEGMLAGVMGVGGVGICKGGVRERGVSVCDGE